MKKTYHFLIDTLEQLVAFFLAIFGLFCMIGVILAIPVLIIASVLDQEWLNAGKFLIWEIVLFLIWQISVRIAEKIQNTPNKK